MIASTPNYTKELSITSGKIPPSALDVEQVILGTCLIDNKGVDVVVRLFSDNDSVFYNPRHQILYKTIYKLKSKNLPIDLITVISNLRETNKLDLAGGDNYIISLTSGVNSSAHIEYHVRIVWEKYIKRKIIEVGSMMIEKAFDETADVFESLDFTSVETNKIQHYLTGQKPVKRLFDVHQDFVQYIKSETVDGVPMPFKKLQEENQGWQKSDMIVIAARPGMGKTALALEIGKYAALSDNSIHFLSLEMANIQLHKRLVANELGINSDAIRKKRLSEQDLQKIFDCAAFEAMPFYYDDDIFKWEEIRSRIRYVAKDKETKLVIIDYLQLITTKDKMSTYERVSYVSREIKLLAKELAIPIIVLSQLSRDVEKRPDKKPQLSDLRESGAIEQDADIVMFPYRPEYYGIETWDEEDEPDSSTKNKALLISAKNRHCGDSETVIGWHGKYQKFYDLDNFQQPINQSNTTVLPTINPNDAFDIEKDLNF